MDGTKLTTDTADNLRICDRQAFCLGRSIFAREYGPGRNENPGESRIIEL